MRVAATRTPIVFEPAFTGTKAQLCAPARWARRFEIDDDAGASKTVNGTGFRSTAAIPVGSASRSSRIDRNQSTSRPRSRAAATRAERWSSAASATTTRSTPRCALTSSASCAPSSSGPAVVECDGRARCFTPADVGWLARPASTSTAGTAATRIASEGHPQPARRRAPGRRAWRRPGSPPRCRRRERRARCALPASSARRSVSRRPAAPSRAGASAAPAARCSAASTSKGTALNSTACVSASTSHIRS